jgi:Fur family ferric uptake transcriptional regulator
MWLMSRDEVDQLLVRKKLKKTAGRVAVLKALQVLGRPVKVQEIVEQLVRDKVSVDQATVYRTLEIFVREGLVEQIDFRDGKYRYELQENHHHHLVCNNCASVQEIEGELLSVDERKVLQDKQFLIQAHTLEFFGLCEKCRVE